MKKIVLAMLLVAAVTAVAQTSSAPAQTQTPAQPGAAAPQQNPSQPAAPQQKKEIKDPAEYNAYVGAVGQTDPNAKVSGLEAFLTQYPNSVMKEDALELLMGDTPDLRIHEFHQPVQRVQVPVFPGGEHRGDIGRDLVRHSGPQSTRKQSPINRSSPVSRNDRQEDNIHET